MIIDKIKTHFPLMTKWGWVGIGSVVLLYVVTAFLNLITLPWQGTADSYPHMDYIYQVSNGHLPSALGYEYMVSPEEHEQQVQQGRRHFTAAHPPLYYFVASIAAHNYLESGQWKRAVASVRLLNLASGIVTVLMLAYFGYKLAGRKGQIFAILTPLVALVVPFVKFTTDTYNDAFIAMWGTLALGVAMLSVKTKPTAVYVILFVLACVAGMYTKATFAGVLLAGLCLMICAIVMHTRGSVRMKVLRSTLLIIGVAVSVALSSGWFYYYNHQRSGIWYRATPKYQLQNRTYKTLEDNITNPQYYNIVPGSLLGQRSLTGAHPYNRTVSLAISTILIVSLLWWAYKNQKTIHRWYKDKRMTWIGAVIVVTIAGLYAQQLQHAIGWGALNPRYFLAGILVFGLTLALAVYSMGKRMLPYLATALAIILCWATIANTAWYGKVKYGVVDAGWGYDLHSLVGLATYNNIPVIVPQACVVLMLLGAVLLWISLHNLISEYPVRRKR